MGRMSFTQELKALAEASEEMDAGGCWREVFEGTSVVLLSASASPR